MEGKIRRIIQKPLFFMMAAQAVVQAIAFFSLPVFSRLFSPEAIGAWGVLMTLSMLFLGFATFKINIALVQAQDDEERNLLFWLGLGLFVATVFLVAVVTKGSFWAAHGQSSFFVIVLLLGAAFHQLLQAVYLQGKKYVPLSAYRLLYGLVLYLLPCVLSGFLGNNALFYCFMAAVWLVPMVFFLRVPSLLPVFSWSKRVLFGLWQKHRKTTGFLTVSSLMDSLNEHFFVLLISSTFGLKMAGLYFFALKLCRAPISLAYSSVSEYNFRHFEQKKQEGDFRVPTLTFVWLKWLLPALGFYGLLVLFGEQVVGFLFGPEWIEAGKVVRLMAISSFFTFLSATTSYAFLTVQKQEILFYLALGYLLRPVLILLMVHFGQGFYVVFATLVALEVIYTVIRNGLLVYLTKQQ